MKRTNRNRIKLLSRVLLLTGGILLFYMILQESEPGALPLLLLLSGTLCWLLHHCKHQKNQNNSNLQN